MSITPSHEGCGRPVTAERLRFSRALSFSLCRALSLTCSFFTPQLIHISWALTQSIAHTSCGERNLEKNAGPFSFHHHRLSHLPNQSMSLRHFGPYSHSCFPHRQSIIAETHSTTHSLKSGFLVFTLRCFFRNSGLIISSMVLRRSTVACKFHWLGRRERRVRLGGSQCVSLNDSVKRNFLSMCLFNLVVRHFVLLCCLAKKKHY